MFAERIVLSVKGDTEAGNLTKAEIELRQITMPEAEDLVHRFR